MKLIEVIKEELNLIDKNTEALTEESKLKEDLDVNDEEMSDLIASLEIRLDISFDEKEIKNLKTVEDVITTVKSKYS